MSGSGSAGEVDLAPDEVAHLVRTHYGFEPLAVARLPSELSTVARVDLPSGVVVAKATPFSPAELEVTRWRVDAMRRLDEIGLPVGRTVPDRRGSAVTVAETGAGPVVLHLTGWLLGEPLAATDPGPDLLLDVGRTAARVALGLAGSAAPPVAIAHPWELARTLSTLDATTSSVTGPAARRLVDAAADRFRRHVAPRLALLPHSVVHHDLHDSNLLVEPATGRVTGVLDFGDMVVGPRVAELAVAAAYASRGSADPVAAFLLVAEGWGHIVPLEDDEIDVLFEAGVGRLAVNLAVWASREHSDRGSYGRTRSQRSSTALAAMLNADRELVRTELRRRLA